MSGDNVAVKDAIKGIDAEPRAGQTIRHHGITYTTIKEGMAHILAPQGQKPTLKGPQDEQKHGQSVFYNPIQQFNRDLSVLAIRAFGEDYVGRRKTRPQRKEGPQRGKKRKRGTESPTTSEAIAAKKVAEESEVRANISAGKEEQTIDDVEATKAASVRQTSEPNYADVQVNREDGREDQHSTTVPKEKEEETTSSGPYFAILDALSASGLRALRYAHEIPFATSVTANDLSPTATRAINVNITHNRLEDKITATTSDARNLMYSNITDRRNRFHVIDLDPYGTAATFFDCAVQSLIDHGLLAVTCTDAGVFASCGYPEKTYSLYNGLPMKGPNHHEAGLRLVLNGIAIAAARYGMSIEPLLSLSIDYYIRVFVRVHHSPAATKFLAGKTIIVYNCDSGCGAWSVQGIARNVLRSGKKDMNFFKYSLAQGPTATPFCEHCGYKTHVAGPMWGGPLHNPHFISRILSYLPQLDPATYATIPRIKGMLSTALEEDLSTPPIVSLSSPPSPETIPVVPPETLDPCPFFTTPSFCSKVLHTTTPTDAALRSALQNLGYQVTRSHTAPGSIKTDAPWIVLWEIIREWAIKEAHGKREPTAKCKPGTAGYEIMKNSRHAQQKVRAADDDVGEANHGDVPSTPAQHAGLEALRAEAASLISSATCTSDLHAQLARFLANLHRQPAQAAKASSNEKATPELPLTLDAVHKLPIVFDKPVEGAAKQRQRLVRYQSNPRANWGPQQRAKAS